MLLDISGNTFSSLGNPQDADAMAFISAASISDTTQITAIDNLVKDLKVANIWNKMNAVYPFVGGTATTHKFNLKDPRDTNAAFRLSFLGGGWTHDANGATPNGTSSYADTFLTASTSLSVSSGHISFYSRIQALLASNLDIGASTGSAAANLCAIGIGRNTNTSLFTWGTQATGTIGIFSGSSSQGFFVGNQNAATAAGRNIYRNASAGTVPSSYGTPVLPTVSFAIGALNDATVGRGNFSSRQCAFASIGSGLTASEISSFNTIVEAYQTALNRQVITATTISRPTLSNVPTVTYNPKQIYNNLFCWVDATDYRNLYTTTTGTTNVSPTATGFTVVNRLEDMANYPATAGTGNRKFYNWSGGGAIGLREDYSNINNLSANSAYNRWYGGLDTNKGSFLNGQTTFIGHPLNMLNPRNHLAPNSAVTLCNYGVIYGTTAGGSGVFGLNYGFYNAGSALGISVNVFTSNLQGQIINSTQNGSRVIFSVPGTQYFGKTIMTLFTVSGNLFSFYINNTLITSSTYSTPTYPISASSFDMTFSYPMLCIDSIIGLNPFFSNSFTLEGFIANDYTSPQQVDLLYNYFRIKFKDRR
jgi:hypothetical protein